MIKVVIFQLAVTGLVQFGRCEAEADAEAGISLPSFNDLMLLARGESRGSLAREEKSLLGTYPFNELHGAQNERPSLHHAVARQQQLEQQHRGGPAFAQPAPQTQHFSQSGVHTLLQQAGSDASLASHRSHVGLTQTEGAYTRASSGALLAGNSAYTATGGVDLSYAANAGSDLTYSANAGRDLTYLANSGRDLTYTANAARELTYSASPASASLLKPTQAQSNALFGSYGLRLRDHSLGEASFPAIQVPSVARGSPTPLPARQPSPTPLPPVVRQPAPVHSVPQPVPIFTGFRSESSYNGPNILVEPSLTYDLLDNFNPNRARNPALGRDPGPVLEVVAEAETKCVDKVEHVEETEYDTVEKCDHSYDKKCHTSYSTEYTSQQEVECDDSYQKDCDITYTPSAKNTTVEVCSRPLVKNCDIPGPVECRTEYVSECWTKHEEHSVVDDVAECETVYDEKCHEVQSGYSSEEKCSKWPREVCRVNKKLNKKVTPEVKCEKVPQELCGPAGCGSVPGPEVCHDKTITVVQDIPSESCNLQPSTKCEHVTKLVPKLVPVEECVDVPKEVCHKVRGPPRTVIKPVTKKWCYKPTPESGLH